MMDNENVINFISRILKDVQSVINFIARECELQEVGPMYVAWMFDAWNYAYIRQLQTPTVEDIVAIADLVNPISNDGGFRSDVEDIKSQMESLVERINKLRPVEFCHEFLEIHPFVEGDSRVSQILFNWLHHMLDDPDWHPSIRFDTRRYPGSGEPRY